MRLFGRNKCQSFFSYHHKKLDIKGISAHINQSNTKIAVGEIIIDPQFVKVTDKLQALDLFQMKICEQINQLDRESPARAHLRVEYIQVLMQMFKISQNPDLFEDGKFITLDVVGRENEKLLEEQQIPHHPDIALFKKINMPSEDDNTKRSDISFSKDKTIYLKSLIERDEIKKTLEYLKNSLQENNIVTLFLAQYSSIETRIIKGLLKNTDIEYKEFVSRLNDFLDSK